MNMSDVDVDFLLIYIRLAYCLRLGCNVCKMLLYMPILCKNDINVD